MISLIFKIILAVVVTLLVVYTIRHYVFTLNRLFGRQRHPYVDIDEAAWPEIAVLIAAHNEEAVIADSIRALLEINYPASKVTIIPVNDRSTDKTAEIIDALVARHPGRIRPFHRTEGKPGKAAALKDAMELVQTEIFLVFDADYLPGRGLLRQLVAPFFDPEVGAVMGRVVPQNVGRNLLTRILDLERAGGYQVDQQARMNLGLLPQYGGTVGGVRMKALADAGGWHDDVLAEDTDLTYRLLLSGWSTVYTNRSECYEEVPEEWPVRVRQIMRWAKGHNQAFARHLTRTLRAEALGFWERVDALLLLGVYVMSPLMMLGWVAALGLFYIEPDIVLYGFVAYSAVFSYSALGNFAAFFEIGVASYLDGSRNRLRILPLNFGGFVVSAVAVTRATLAQVTTDLLRRGDDVKWDKTARYRRTPS